MLKCCIEIIYPDLMHNDDAVEILSIFELKIDGTLNFEASRFLTSLLGTLIAGGCKYLILSLQSVSSIDSAGLGIIINHTKKVRDAGGDLVIVHIPEKIEYIFRMTNINKVIKLFNVEGDAVRHILASRSMEK